MSHQPPDHDDREATIAFGFATEYPFAHVGRLFGVQPERARLELTGDRVLAVFGPWRIETLLENIADVEVTGPYNPVKVIGPAHVSLADGGLTFATTTRQGLCLRFKEAVPGALPLPLPRHGSLTVTVEDAPQVKQVLERGMRELNRTDDVEEAQERLRQTEHDVVQGMSASELRTRAELVGVEHATSMSHDELVEVLESRDLDGDAG